MLVDNRALGAWSRGLVGSAKAPRLSAVAPPPRVSVAEGGAAGGGAGCAPPAVVAGSGAEAAGFVPSQVCSDF